ncbi:MAG TPA: outer membrane beta-barrel protein [Vicinamibacterales bacterium]|jgi:opacity protein-like surface antigen
MMQKTTTMLLVCGLALAGASAVSAQGTDKPDRGFVSVAGGFQVGGRTTDESGTFSLYDESGTFTGSRKISNGAFFEVGGGMHVSGKFSVGASFSRFAKASTVVYTASIPHPLFFDSPRTAALTVNDLGHTESVVHIQAIYRVMDTKKYDVSVVGGPSIFSVSEDTVSTISATETGSPFTALSLAATFGSASKRGIGFNVGADANYTLTRVLAAGLNVKYTYASLSMPGTGGATHDVKAGGLQVGIGLRYRF